MIERVYLEGATALALALAFVGQGMVDTVLCCGMRILSSGEALVGSLSDC